MCRACARYRIRRDNGQNNLRRESGVRVPASSGVNEPVIENTNGQIVVVGAADKRVYHATLVLQASVFRVSMQIAGELILTVRKWGASRAGNKMKSSVIEWQRRLTSRSSATMFAVEC